MTAPIERSDVITTGPAEALAGLLGVPLPDLERGAGLPLMWHWAYLLERPAQEALGSDGHPLVGLPSPAAPGRRRMFAGGRVRAVGALRLGPAIRRSRVSRTTEKVGRSGRMTFVTVVQDVVQEGRTVLTEELDIVYRDADGPGSVSPAEAPSGRPGDIPAPDHRIAVVVDPVLLFRFSALTYNGHRIHYDRDYARDVEGYPGLVVHGPLQVILMAEAARHAHPTHCAQTARAFDYRLVSPLFEHQGLEVTATLRDGRIHTGVLDATGRRTAEGALLSTT